MHAARECYIDEYIERLLSHLIVTKMAFRYNTMCVCVRTFISILNYIPMTSVQHTPPPANAVFNIFFYIHIIYGLESARYAQWNLFKQLLPYKVFLYRLRDELKMVLFFFYYGK